VRIGFLGPEGTFTEEALLSSSSLRGNELIPLPSIQDVIAAVERLEVDKGIVPIENSIEGAVNTTLDMLAFEVDLLIEQEIVRSISHNLIGPAGLDKKQIERVVSIPMATAQCRAYLMREIPGAKIMAAASTADAVNSVAREADGKTAAIGTSLAARLYGLEVLDENIQDAAENQTRFVVIGREASPPTGFDKTSIVCFILQDRPGSLLSILQVFAERNINLTKIASRPTRKALGEYCFFVDLEGHKEDPAVAEALRGLRENLRQVKLLGSYPRARRPEAK
jgi:prephenate dehydratase